MKSQLATYQALPLAERLWKRANVCSHDARLRTHPLGLSSLAVWGTSDQGHCRLLPDTSIWHHCHRGWLIIEITMQIKMLLQLLIAIKKIKFQRLVSPYLSVRTNPLSSNTGTFCIGLSLVNSGVLCCPRDSS